MRHLKSQRWWVLWVIATASVFRTIKEKKGEWGNFTMIDLQLSFVKDRNYGIVVEYLLLTILDYGVSH